VVAELKGAPLCSNGNIDPREECDGVDLNGQTCVTLGYAGGPLGCSASCAFDTSLCNLGPNCANNIAEFSEVCDGPDLHSKTCQTQGFAYGKLACNGTCDGFDTSGCTNSRFVDNADGTITDWQTGLMWEKKVGAGGAPDAGLQDADNTYPWSGSARPAVTTASRMRAPRRRAPPACRATRRDVPSAAGWRHVQRHDHDLELLGAVERGLRFCRAHGLAHANAKRVVEHPRLHRRERAARTAAFNGVNCAAANTNINDPTHSCTQSSPYWSSTTLSTDAFSALYVLFNNGTVDNNDKATTVTYVRGVRTLP